MTEETGETEFDLHGDPVWQQATHTRYDKGPSYSHGIGLLQESLVTINALRLKFVGISYNLLGSSPPSTAAAITRELAAIYVSIAKVRQDAQDLLTAVIAAEKKSPSYPQNTSTPGKSL
jgi:hypothetical protein